MVRRASAVVVVLLAAGCTPAASEGTAVPGAAGSDSGGGHGGEGFPAGTPGLFVDVTMEAGLGYMHAHLPENVDTLPCKAFELFSGGAAAADVDGDGDVDLFVTRLYLYNILFLNQGDGTFAEAGATAGVEAVTASGGAAFGDVDGDGDLDLYVTTVGTDAPMLYINDGRGAFTEEAAARGAALFVPPAPACVNLHSPTFADVDLDGDLDLFVSQWHRVGPGSVSEYTRLLLNDGTGQFQDGSVASGLDLPDVAAFASSFEDVDGDLIPDALVAGDFHTSRLLHGNGDGTFTNVTRTAGVGTDQFGMGSAVADLDDDGDVDWFVTAIHDPMCPTCDGNRLYLNDGAGAFVDRTDAAGVREGGWGWGAAFFDFDNDGDLDLAMSNGMGADIPGQPPGAFTKDSARLWRNDRGMAMKEVSAELGFVDDRQGRALVPFDADGDGDLDVFVANAGDHPALFKNNVADGKSWLVVRLRSGGKNTHGVGVVVHVRATPDSAPRRRHISLNSTFDGHGPPEAHFGLGDHDGPVHEVRVLWPGRAEPLLLADVSPNQVLVVQVE